ncbi:hypothetical protein TRIUR3_25224 [Triticum urartu]|uniref:Uncharacterized protein n=1 Tax=Triticum urartu TaxID=4572 RepID=M7Z8A5_TRIUA|nr:hypothetical protein TRIUR3_25224 [Triticum urartu]
MAPPRAGGQPWEHNCSSDRHGSPGSNHAKFVVVAPSPSLAAVIASASRPVRRCAWSPLLLRVVHLRNRPRMPGPPWFLPKLQVLASPAISGVPAPSCRPLPCLKSPCPVLDSASSRGGRTPRQIRSKSGARVDSR